jgi:hypothetical protein
MLNHVLITTTCTLRQSSLIISRQREQHIRRGLGSVLACFHLWVTNRRFVFILRRLDSIEKNRMENALTLFIPRFFFVMVGVYRVLHMILQFNFRKVCLYSFAYAQKGMSPLSRTPTDLGNDLSEELRSRMGKTQSAQSFVSIPTIISGFP